MNQEQLLARAQGRVKSAEESIADFSAKLLKDPVHTVNWGSTLFSATGDLIAGRLILSIVEGGCDLESVVENLELYVVQGAVRVPHSSNYCSNRVEQETTRAYAEAYREFKRMLDNMKKQAAANTATS